MIKVIYGAPCSGKSTYISNHADPSDLIYDYDALRSVISTEPKYSSRKTKHQKTLLDIRSTMIKDHDGLLWIQTTWPSEQLCELLPDSAEFARMEATREECLERLEADDRREDKEYYKDLINKWFDDHGDQEFERCKAMNKDAKLRMSNYSDERFVRTRPEDFKTRDDSGNPIIEGYFAVFNSNYELWDGATESIAPGAFDSSIAGDIRALINHDTTLVIGRTTNGTLELKVDSRGLWGRILINPKDQDAMNIHARVERGDVTQCSFGFYIRSEDTEYLPDGSIHWTLTDVELFEVSCCTFPAYEETSISARKRDAEDLISRKREAWKLKTLARLKKQEDSENGNSNIDAPEEAERC